MRVVPGRVRSAGSAEGTEHDVPGAISSSEPFGVLVAHLFSMDNVACAQSVRQRAPLLTQVRKVSLERDEFMIK